MALYVDPLTALTLARRSEADRIRDAADQARLRGTVRGWTDRRDAAGGAPTPPLGARFRWRLRRSRLSAAGTT